MADPGAGVDVVGTQGGTNHLLDNIDLFVGTAGRGNPAQGIDAVLSLDRLETIGGKGNGFLPVYFPPVVVNAVTDHGSGDPVRMTGIAPGKAAFDTGVAGVGPALLVRHHTHQFITPKFCHEGAADTAVGAGGLDLASRHPQVDNALLLQGRRGTGLDAGTTGNTFAVQEAVLFAGRYLGFKASTGNGQRKGALDL